MECHAQQAALIVAGIEGDDLGGNVEEGRREEHFITNDANLPRLVADEDASRTIASIGDGDRCD